MTLTNGNVPADWGLPSKFAAWRPYQLEAVKHIVASTKRFAGAAMPTGNGKSAMYMAAALQAPPDVRVMVLVPTKLLQDQLLADFSTTGLVAIMGQGNYECIQGDVRHLKVGCDDGPCHFKVPCPYRPSGCEYYDAEARARGSRLVVTNYQFWLHHVADPEDQGIGKFQMLVCDEADQIFDELTTYLSCRLTGPELRLINQELPDYPQNEKDHREQRIEPWIGAAQNWLDIAYKKHIGLSSILEQSFSYDVYARATAVRKLMFKLERLATARAREWVCQLTRQGSWAEPTADFSCVWPASYAERCLFTGIQRIVLTSATLTRKALACMGVSPPSVDLAEYPSTFELSRRPVFVVPSVRLDHKTGPDEWAMWLHNVEDIIEPRLRWKGMVHTVSYERAHRMKRQSKLGEYFLTHTKETLAETVERFKKAQPPCVLVSPSVWKGYDFPYDECRWQVLPKVPFPDKRDILLQAREKIDSDYGAHEAAQVMQQAAGRSPRYEDDWSEALIADDHFSWFYKENKRFFNKWFCQAVQVLDHIPDPLGLTFDK